LCVDRGANSDTRDVWVGGNAIGHSDQRRRVCACNVSATTA
jgi:hypothetical protein